MRVPLMINVLLEVTVGKVNYRRNTVTSIYKWMSISKATTRIIHKATAVAEI